MDYDRDERPRNRKADKGINALLESSTVRLTTMVSFCVFLVVMTMNITSSVTMMVNEQSNLADDVSDLSSQVSELRTAVTALVNVRTELVSINEQIESLKGRTSEQWNRSHMKQLCRENELINAGWKCGNTEFDGYTPSP